MHFYCDLCNVYLYKQLKIIYLLFIYIYKLYKFNILFIYRTRNSKYSTTNVRSSNG